MTREPTYCCPHDIDIMEYCAACEPCPCGRTGTPDGMPANPMLVEVGTVRLVLCEMCRRNLLDSLLRIESEAARLPVGGVGNNKPLETI